MLDLRAYEADQVAVDGSTITVTLEVAGSFVIHADGVWRRSC